MSLVRMLRGGQVTLPAEARKALRLHEGDYLDLVVSNGALTLKPVAVIDRAKAWDDLVAIVSRGKWIGPGPEPSEDEVMAMVVDEIDASRADDDKSRSR